MSRNFEQHKRVANYTRLVAYTVGALAVFSGLLSTCDRNTGTKAPAEADSALIYANGAVQYTRNSEVIARAFEPAVLSILDILPSGNVMRIGVVDMDCSLHHRGPDMSQVTNGDMPADACSELGTLLGLRNDG